MTLTPKTWGLIGGGLLLIALLVGLLATRAMLDGERTRRVATEERLGLSNASVSRLTEEMERIVDEQKALATSDATRMQASREALQLADAASAVRLAAIDKLKASAAVARGDISAAPAEPPAACEISEAVAEVWK